MATLSFKSNRKLTGISRRIKVRYNGFSATEGANMLLGAVTYNILKDWDLDTILTKLEAAGFDAVELRTGHKHGVEPSLDAAGRERVKARFARSKARLLSFGSTCEFHSPDANERRKQAQIGKQFIDRAHETGPRAAKTRPNGLPSGYPYREFCALVEQNK